MTKVIELTQGFSTIVDDDDYSNLLQYSWWALVQNDRVYAATSTRENKSLRMHRVVTKARPGDIVDHDNDDTLDNRRENLVIRSHSLNLQRSRKVYGFSAFKGVAFDASRNKCWLAQVWFQGRKVASKRFLEEKEAAQFYDRIITQYHGRDAIVNFPRIEGDTN